MNAHVEQLGSRNDLPEDVAASHYGKVPPPDALKHWLGNFKGILDQFIDTPSQDVLNEVASLKEGLRIISQRAWTKGQLQAIEKWWKPDDLISEVGDLTKDLQKRTPRNTERDQLIDDLARLAVLLKYRFNQSEPGTLRPIYAMVAAAVAVALGAHFIPEKSNAGMQKEDPRIEVVIPEIEIPEDEIHDMYPVNPFPGKMDEPTTKKPESNPGGSQRGSQPKKTAQPPRAEPAPKAKKPTNSKVSTSPDEELTGAWKKTLGRINAPAKNDGGMNTTFGSLLDGKGTDSGQLQIGKGDQGMGFRPGKGTGTSGGSGLMLGTIDTGGGRGRGNALDTTVYPLIGSDNLNGMSSSDELRYIRNYLSKNGISMDSHLASIVKKLPAYENGKTIGETDFNNAIASMEELEEKIGRKIGDNWLNVRAHIRWWKLRIERLASRM